jgi:hypothetical protein
MAESKIEQLIDACVTQSWADCSDQYDEAQMVADARLELSTLQASAKYEERWKKLKDWVQKTGVQYEAGIKGLPLPMQEKRIVRASVFDDIYDEIERLELESSENKTERE